VCEGDEDEGEVKMKIRKEREAKKEELTRMDRMDRIGTGQPLSTARRCDTLVRVTSGTPEERSQNEARQGD